MNDPQVTKPTPSVDTPATEPRYCAGCGIPLVGPFCQSCGRRADPLVGPLQKLVAEFWEEFAGFDTRLVRTLRDLFVPGRLTRRYLEGQGAAYATPVRLYLVVSVIYFISLSWTGSTSFFFFNPGSDESSQQLVEFLPRMMIVILPAYALILKLLFPKRLLAEHLVFALHYHAFAYLALTAHAFLEPYGALFISFGETQLAGDAGAAAVAAAGSWWNLLASILDGIAQLAVFVYLFMALRRVYGGSRLAAFVRMNVLFLGYIALLVAASTLLISILGRFG